MQEIFWPGWTRFLTHFQIWVNLGWVVSCAEFSWGYTTPNLSFGQRNGSNYGHGVNPVNPVPMKWSWGTFMEFLYGLCFILLAKNHKYPYISIHHIHTYPWNFNKLDQKTGWFEYWSYWSIKHDLQFHRGIDTKDSGSHRSDAHTAAYHLWRWRPGAGGTAPHWGLHLFCVAHHVTWLPRWKMGWFSDPSLVIFMTPRVVNPIAIP